MVNIGGAPWPIDRLDCVINVLRRNVLEYAVAEHEIEREPRDPPAAR
jgi:hypothetical protein